MTDVTVTARRVPGTLPTAIVSAAIGIVVAAGAVADAGPWQGGQRTSERDAGPKASATVAAKELSQLPTGPRHVPAAAALDPVFAGDGTVRPTTAAALAAVLAPLTAAAGLGRHVGVAVADPGAAGLLYDKSASEPFAPASTNKVVTAVAALAGLGPEARFTTRVVTAPAGGAATTPGTASATPSTTPGTASIVLVGGGDPTLSTLPPPASATQSPQPSAGTAAPASAYQPATVDDLAAQTATALEAAGVKSVTLGYDASLYSGPALHPTWPSGYTDGNVAPVTPLMVDEGRTKAADDLSPRAADPAAAAAAAFGARLAAHGVAVTGKPAAVAASDGGTELAHVDSPRVADLVEHMLTVSDNDLAEAFLRHIAIADGKPPTFDGGVAAVRDVLGAKTLGLDLSGYSVLDGSGLSRQDRITPSFLVRVLSLAASTSRPDLRAALTGLPVAGFTGTLAENGRFGTMPAQGAAGLVRAKTGSLTGVSTLAGLVRDADGELLVFALMADQAPDATASRNALDRLAAGIAGA